MQGHSGEGRRAQLVISSLSRLASLSRALLCSTRSALDRVPRIDSSCVGCRSRSPQRFRKFSDSIGRIARTVIAAYACKSVARGGITTRGIRREMIYRSIDYTDDCYFVPPSPSSCTSSFIPLAISHARIHAHTCSADPNNASNPGRFSAHSRVLGCVYQQYRPQ
jgi:hypothetical protein